MVEETRDILTVHSGIECPVVGHLTVHVLDHLLGLECDGIVVPLAVVEPVADELIRGISCFPCVLMIDVHLAIDMVGAGKIAPSTIVDLHWSSALQCQHR